MVGTIALHALGELFVVPMAQLHGPRDQRQAYWSAHPAEYGTIYGGGGCMLAALAHLFGVPRFIRILHKYASDEWFGNARTAEFKAIIEANAARDLTGFDPVAFWAKWRVD